VRDEILNTLFESLIHPFLINLTGKSTVWSKKLLDGAVYFADWEGELINIFVLDTAIEGFPDVRVVTSKTFARATAWVPNMNRNVIVSDYIKGVMRKTWNFEANLPGIVRCAYLNGEEVQL
jgi:hypothetical protein